jgi:hypothetical protein
MSADVDDNLNEMDRVWMLKSAGRISRKIRHEVGFRCFKCEEKYPSGFLFGARKHTGRRHRVPTSSAPTRLAFLIWSVPDSGGWLFVALFLLAHAAVWTPKKEELPTTRFAPA